MARKLKTTENEKCTLTRIMARKLKNMENETQTLYHLEYCMKN
ncbi:hypothetical protein T09_3546 [Trichinella sp. T9]|nr:hypothetical protein T09_3546 [Trichinella sp. T9]